MDFEWDEEKAQGNFAKHGIDFADAVTVLDDDRAITIKEPHAEEDRFVTLGRDAAGRVLIVIYTWRGDTVRLISARKATPRERRQYAGTP